jgi:hypothetical protein
MAGDWIKIEHGLPGKPEVMQLADILGIDELTVVGHLVLFWTWVDQNLSPDCPVVSGTKSGLDRVSQRDGFTTAMVQVGWLTMEAGRVSIPNYDHHLSESAKKRALDTRKKQRQRNLSRSCPEAVPLSAGQKGGLEKRREEKSIKEVSKDTSSAERCSEPADESGFVFATIGGTWHLPEKKLAEYVATYRFDVRKELLKAAQWLRDNRDRRPRSSKGMAKFLTSWMNRVDDRIKPSSTLGGKITNDDSLKAEMARAKAIREARANGQVPNIS